MDNNRYDEQERKECCICDSELCYWLGDKGCSNCYISTLKSDEEKQKALENWKIMLSNLPENIDELHESDDCVLCKGTPGKGKYYAAADMAHPDPESKKGMILGFGKKVRVPVGSLFTLKLKACKECRRSIALIDYSFLITLVIFIAAGLITVSVPTVTDALLAINDFMTIAVLAIFIAGGYGIGKLFSYLFRKKAEARMNIDLKDIPLVRRMLANRWFFFQENKGIPKIFFSKKKDFKNIFRKEDISQAEKDRKEDISEQEEKTEIEDAWSKFID